VTGASADAGFARLEADPAETGSSAAVLVERYSDPADRAIEFIEKIGTV
jgi:hypothetical protein